MQDVHLRSESSRNLATTSHVMQRDDMSTVPGSTGDKIAHPDPRSQILLGA